MQKDILFWDKKYETGVYPIDFEHQVFLSHINNLQWAIEHNAPKKELEEIAENLGRYAKFHFTSEEYFMKKINYPGIDAQKKLHSELLDSFQSSYSLSEDYTAFLDFLKDWFIKHTVLTDHKIGEYMKHKNIDIKDYTYSIFR